VLFFEIWEETNAHKRLIFIESREVIVEISMIAIHPHESVRTLAISFMGLLLISLTAQAGYLRADFNLDGVVDTNDLALWTANQGRVSSVPRPETVLTPSLRITPDRRTMLAGENITLTASGGSNTVHWAFVKNPAGGNLTATTGVSIAYVAGNTNAEVDIIQAWDEENLLSRTYMNVISASEVASLGKAIIVAGGKSFDDPVWLATDYIADKAYNVLRYRGFSKDNIQYLSFDPNQDADGNDLLDDIDLSSAFTNTAWSFTNWAENANQLLVYLADHGSDSAGQGFFRLNSTEILAATNVDAWLDNLQDTYNMDVTVIMDFCYAGSFLDELEYTGTAKRILLAAASSNELTYFIAGGAVSFSDLFWSGILQGQDIKSSFDLAKEGMDSFQTSVLEDGDGGAHAENRYVGATFVAGKDYPIIGSVLGVQLLNAGTTATLWADDIESYYPLERVWCTVIPPSHSPNTNTGIPVVDIPVIDLVYDNILGRHQNSFAGFAEQGTYRINYYAQDIWGSVSPPKPSAVIQAGIDERLILVSGGTTNDADWFNQDSVARTVYQTFLARQISSDRIFYLSASTNQDVNADGTNDVDRIATMANLTYAFTNWSTNAGAITLYLIGGETNGSFRLNQTEVLNASQIDSLLDAFQSSNFPVNVVMEFPRSGGYIPSLAPPAGRERINISAAKTDQSNLLAAGGLLSFSSHFMSQIVNGKKIGEAFKSARSSIRLASGSARQLPQIDDDGDGIPDERNVDGNIAILRYFGAAFVTGDDKPSIGSVTPTGIITGYSNITLWAKDVLDVDGISNVWAIVTPPSYDGSGTLPETNLTFNAVNNRYETLYELTQTGSYTITYFAQDNVGNLSPPSQTSLDGPDSYETDDANSQAGFFDVADPQVHSLHDADDEDWVKFYAITGFVYTIAAEQLGDNSDVSIDVYWERPDGTLSNIFLDEDITGPGVGELESLSLNFPADPALQEGFYYVRVSQSSLSPGTYGADSDYELSVTVVVGAGQLIVIAVDRLASNAPPPGAVATLDGVSNKVFGTATSVAFLNVPDGVHTLTVTAAAGYLMEEDPNFPNQENNPDNSLYGNPKNKTVQDTAWQTVVFQFVPYAQALGTARDQLTGEFVEGAKIEFIATSGIISNLVYDGYPNFATYKTQWFSRADGTFPTNVLLPTVHYNLTLSKSGYSNANFAGVVNAPAPGSVIDLGLRYMIPADTNGNGIADSWESLYFPGTNVVANEDYDLDGQSNLNEYRTGTNPTNPASVFMVNESKLGTGLIISWPVAPGRSYQVDAIESLITGNWDLSAGPWTASVGQSSMTYTNLTTATGRYHRVEALVP